MGKLMCAKSNLPQQENILRSRDHSIEGYWEWNLKSDEVFFSLSWKKMLGYGDGEIEDNLFSWVDCINPEDRVLFFAQVEACLDGKSDLLETEMRLIHKDGHEIATLCKASRIQRNNGEGSVLVGSHRELTQIRRAEAFNETTNAILEMIAIGRPATEVYDAIALMCEGRHPGMRCSMLELEGDILLHGGAPSLPEAYCEAVHGLAIGPDIGSCGTSTYTGERCLVEDIATDPKWAKLKQYALPHGLRCCWSEPITSSAGDVLGAFGMYYDYPALPNEEELSDLVSAARLAGLVMERDHDQKRILHLAYTDELTGVASRAHLYLKLEECITTSKRYDHRFGLIYLDLDDFKDINDSLGHDVGDHVLKVIANRLQSICRETDFVARMSGDEFCIIAEKLGDDSSAALLAKRCQTAVCQPLELAARKIKLSCSIGIAYFPGDGGDFTALIKASDTALYEAKKLGKNQYTFYRPELTLRAEYRFRFESYLREAIENESLTLAYQPLVDISSEEIIGVEALCRWHHETLGDLAPAEFVATAERIGMIKPLTDWALTTACRQAVAWRKAGKPELIVSANISASYFIDRDIIPLVKKVITETGIPPGALVLEVTEGVVQTTPENLSIFKELKELGVLLALDDFGTGYSSFASLKHLEVDYLKIDRHFVSDMLVDTQSMTLLDSMIEMGQNLGHEIIVEGIETREQLDALKDLNCRIGQGYLFNKPLSAAELETLMSGESK